MSSQALLILFALLLLVGCALPTDAAQTAQTREECKPDPAGPAIKKSAFPEADDSAYILPFEPGKSFLIWRTTSHYNAGNKGVGLYAIDIEMPVGTPLIAIRAGRVVAVQESFPDGNDKDLEENFVMVEHEDKTVSRYIHLKQGGALVAADELVNQGQRIALSGNSGQTGGPHLHLDVQTCGPNLPPGYNTLPCGQTVPLNFRNTGDNECGLVANKVYFAAPKNARSHEQER